MQPVTSHTRPMPILAPPGAATAARPDRPDGVPVLVVDDLVVPLPVRGPLVLGSGREADVLVDDDHVSGRHLAVTRAGRAVRVRDVGSTNGTWHDGRRVERERLDPGDVIHLAHRPILVAEGGFSHRYPDAVRWHGMVARDRRSLAVLRELAVAGASDAPVWLWGESGTGKEGAARALHCASPRRRGPRVAINCAALPASLAESELFGVVRGAFTGADRTRPGAFEQADGGTLLLDEVGELPVDLQAKLLRVLETGQVFPVGSDRPRRVDVRVVASTWRDLSVAATEGRFRFDLLQRLWVLRVDLPALRDRPDDLGPLLEEFLGGDVPDALWPDPLRMEALRAARWPGNVRELRNRARRAMVAGDLRRLLPEREGREPTRLPRRGTVPDEVVLARIRTALARTRGNRAAAARELGIGRATLYRWLDRA
ncbi:MAG: sigma 54-interacting transcriptional regulator [Myxococcota bacterium]